MKGHTEDFFAQLPDPGLKLIKLNFIVLKLG